MYCSDEDGDSDEEVQRPAPTRRGSLIQQGSDARDRIALDISLLKKQYAKLRERQRQAQIILTNTARQTVNPTVGRRRSDAFVKLPVKKAMPAPVIATSKSFRKSPKLTNRTEIRGVNELNKSGSGSESTSTPSKVRQAFRKSESSSYSEDSENDDDVSDSTSSSTSLCDEDMNMPSSLEGSPLKIRNSREDFVNDSSSIAPEPLKDSSETALPSNLDDAREIQNEDNFFGIPAELLDPIFIPTFDFSVFDVSPTTSVSPSTSTSSFRSDLLACPQITSTSQLSPIADISSYISSSNISPLRTPSATPFFWNFDVADFEAAMNQADASSKEDTIFQVNEEGVTNEYFEHVNQLTVPSERPSRSQSDDHIVLEIFSKRELEPSPVFQRRFVLNAPGKSPKKIAELSTIEDSEASASSIVENRNTDRALRIIEENTRILHRILKKNAPPDEEDESWLKSPSAFAKDQSEMEFDWKRTTEFPEDYRAEAADSPTAPIEDQNPLDGKTSPKINKADVQKLEDENLEILKTFKDLFEIAPQEILEGGSLSEQNITDFSESCSEGNVAHGSDSVSQRASHFEEKARPKVQNREWAEEPLKASSSFSEISEKPSVAGFRWRPECSPPRSSVRLRDGDISDTLSSIENTIKSVRSLCQDGDRLSRERTDKTLNHIIKVVEQMDSKEKRAIEDSRKGSTGG